MDAESPRTGEASSFFTGATSATEAGVTVAGALSDSVHAAAGFGGRDAGIDTLGEMVVACSTPAGFAGSGWTGTTSGLGGREDGAALGVPVIGLTTFAGGWPGLEAGSEDGLVASGPERPAVLARAPRRDLPRSSREPPFGTGGAATDASLRGVVCVSAGVSTERFPPPAAIACCRDLATVGVSATSSAVAGGCVSGVCKEGRALRLPSRMGEMMSSRGLGVLVASVSVFEP